MFTARAFGVSGAQKKKKRNKDALNSLSEISVGDLVVHQNHGIGRYAGIQRMAVQGVTKDYLRIEYDKKDVLYVPVTQLDLLSRYTAPGDSDNVKLSRLGGSDWAKTRKKVKAATEQMAKELIELYARRKQAHGYAFPADDTWQGDFEQRFAYEETPDQLTCAADIKHDMEEPWPMDRLLCGDVGVGKTEVTKIIAEEMTGVKPITLNMAEYHSPASINRIIGAPAGYVGSESHAELPFDTLESNPYQVILLDEFEKADRSVQRLFMNAFDEGNIKTSKGRTVDFSKAIIIATTNASHTTGATHALGFVSDNTNKANAHRSTVDTLANWFDTELLNRFTMILTFHELSRDVYRDIVADIYKREIARIKHEYRSVKMADELDDATLDTIVDETYVPKFGARPAGRAVQDYIESNPI